MVVFCVYFAIILQIIVIYNNNQIAHCSLHNITLICTNLYKYNCNFTKVTIHLYLVPTLRVRGDIPPISTRLSYVVAKE